MDKINISEYEDLVFEFNKTEIDLNDIIEFRLKTDKEKWTGRLPKLAYVPIIDREVDIAKIYWRRIIDSSKSSYVIYFWLFFEGKSYGKDIFISYNNKLYYIIRDFYVYDLYLVDNLLTNIINVTESTTIFISIYKSHEDSYDDLYDNYIKWCKTKRIFELSIVLDKYDQCIDANGSELIIYYRYGPISIAYSIVSKYLNNIKFNKYIKIVRYYPYYSIDSVMVYNMDHINDNMIGICNLKPYKTLICLQYIIERLSEYYNLVRIELISDKVSYYTFEIRRIPDEIDQFNNTIITI